MTHKSVTNKTTSELVVCSNPRRDITCYPLQGLEIWHRITISGSHSKWLLIFLPTYSRYPWTGLCTLSYLFGRSYYPIATGSLCFPVLCVRFSLTYLHNTLYTKNSCFRTYILNLHVCRISLACFYSWDIPQIVLYLYTVYGGMLTSICIWFGHASASIISTFFSMHSLRKISPISFFIWPYTICRLYFGANTMWYSHLYVECAVLFISFLISLKTSCYF